jgi:opacity protein-like surface antigen
MKKIAAGLWIVALALAAGMGFALAEDVKGKVYFGANLAVLITSDNIRSNAALIIAPLGNDGAPFTGDKGEIVSCDTGRSDVFCDPRPDNLLSRQTQIQQTLKLDGHIGYGLTSNFSIQLDTGYYKGDVTNFDVFTRKVVPFSTSPVDPQTATDPCLKLGENNPFGGPCQFFNARTKNLSQPIKAGQVTEVPLIVNGIVRFRKDSNFNPYIGAGVGYLFTGLTESHSVGQLNARLEKLHLITATDEFGDNFGKILTTPDGDGNAIFNLPASVKIDQGFEWQVVGGGEYFFNDRLSLVFDARYVVSGQQVTISMNGQDQVNLTSYTEDLFRPDGSLKIFIASDTPPNPVIDPNASSSRYVCDFRTSPPPLDYDGKSGVDGCYGGPGFVNPTETIVVQGGRIRLSNFNFGFGIRFHF